MKSEKLHTFVICAYEQSPYLEECIQSLERQSVPSRVIMITHTPCDFIAECAGSHGIPLYVNTGKGGITDDWNYGISCVRTPYATIAHQDDLYEPLYTQTLLSMMIHADHPLIGFSDYYELRDGKKTDNTRMLNIKKIMLIPLRPAKNQKSKFWRRIVLSTGDAICCPSVMFCLENVRQPIFKNHFEACEDWEAWEMLSRRDGDFIYVHKPLMTHRIHQDSTTSMMIEQGRRTSENYEMFRKFWPPQIARFLNYLYRESEKSNRL